jgi:hypothetical protein
MGKPASGADDIGIGRVEHSFTATGQSATMVGRGAINFTLSGTFVATVAIERSFDGGTTWHPVFTPDGLIARSFTAPVSTWTWEGEAGVLYRLNCTAFTSGTAVARLSC